eukprot:EG_transcript_1433
MDLLTASVDLLRNSTQLSTDSMTHRLQELLLTQAVQDFDTLLMEGENEMGMWEAVMQSSGVLQCDLRPSVFDSRRQFLAPYHAKPFATLKGHPTFSMVAISGAVRGNNGTANSSRVFLLAGTAFFADFYRNTSGNRTLYISTMALAPGSDQATLNTSYVDQTTAAPVAQLAQQTFPASSFDMVFDPSGWDNDLGFSPYSGQVQLSRWQWLPAQNDTFIQVSFGISVETISQDLRDQLADSPTDRLALFFRQPHGHLIATSHGKYYSDSDVDHRYLNPPSQSPNATAYRLWTCLQSDDALIRQACQQLYGTYRSWTAIPALRQETVLSGQRYWVATAFSTSSTNLQSTVLLLSNRAAVIGPIDASNAEVERSVAEKKGITFAILGLVSCMGLLLPLAVGLWLTSRLHTLTTAMDRVAQLQFTDPRTPRTVFQELHRIQMSFVHMERGLRAFANFVPQAVVKVLIAGGMTSADEMLPAPLTIMFADIEGFSSVCEVVPVPDLVAVCTEYFEAMCGVLTQHNGTIDKFIGDCIMALWNAPERLPGHEKAAVTAALAMQESVMALHAAWQQRRLPVLRFRLGLHTGVCLVGNFGCSHRVSYTCLGDGVNLAARLEALNKKFGTYLCLSRATYEGCRDDFQFRRLARVTVPGKSEVLPVYEVLCEATHAETSFVACLPGSTVRTDLLESHSVDSGLFGEFRTRSCTYSHSARTTSHDRSVSTDHLNQPQVLVPYHWTRVDRAALLQQARQYEAAYEAMVAGKPAEARDLLMAETLLDIPDRAWTVLVDQLEHMDAGQPWDGVLRFSEK